jgi:4'-phosphopantetheinyl transferase
LNLISPKIAAKNGRKPRATAISEAAKGSASFAEGNRPLRPPELANRQIIVWTLPLTAPDGVVRLFAELLTPAEQARMERFRLDGLRRSFAISRGALRILLGYYSHTSPQAIEFTYGPNGKPSITRPTCIRFNVSHSGNLALLAFTLDCEIGIDLECIRPVPDLRSLAERFFCPEETAELLSIPASQRDRAFFQCWTRKEAYVKGIGQGLALPLDSFRVTLRPEEPVRLVRPADCFDAVGWTITDLTRPDYAGAVAYRDSDYVIEIRPEMNPAMFFSLTSLRLGG